MLDGFRIHSQDVPCRDRSHVFLFTVFGGGRVLSENTAVYPGIPGTIYQVLIVLRERKQHARIVSAVGSRIYSKLLFASNLRVLYYYYL